MDRIDVGVKVRVKLLDGQLIEGWLYGETHDGLYLAIDEKAEQIRFIPFWKSIEKESYGRADFYSYLNTSHSSPNISKLLEQDINKALDKVDYNRIRRIQNEFVTLLNRFYDPKPYNLERLSSSSDIQIIYEIKESKQEGAQFTLLETSLRLKIAYTELIDELNKSRIKAILIENAEEIQNSVSTNGLPIIDFELFSQSQTRLNLLLVQNLARETNLISETDAGQQQLDKITVDKLVEITQGENLVEPEQEEKSKWPKRLKITSALGKVALGGSLAAVNVSLGSIAGIIAALPTLGAGAVGGAFAVVSSTYGGLNTACDGLRDIANVMESK